MLFSGTAVMRSGVHCTAACDAAVLRCCSTYLSSLAASTSERSGTHARAGISRSAAPLNADGLGGCGAARHSRRAEQQTQHVHSRKGYSACCGVQGIACRAHQADPEAPEAEEVCLPGSLLSPLLYCVPLLLEADPNRIGDGWFEHANVLLVTESPVYACTIPFLRPFFRCSCPSSLVMGRQAIGRWPIVCMPFSPGRGQCRSLANRRLTPLHYLQCAFPHLSNRSHIPGWWRFSACCMQLSACQQMCWGHSTPLAAPLQPLNRRLAGGVRSTGVIPGQRSNWDQQRPNPPPSIPASGGQGWLLPHRPPPSVRATPLTGPLYSAPLRETGLSDV